MKMSASSTSASSASASAAAAMRYVRVDREKLEKERLASRRQGFPTHHPEEILGVKAVTPAADTPSYIDDHERFQKDVAAEERRRREVTRAKEEKRILHLRDDTLARDERRWHDMSERAAAEEERIARFRATGYKATKNQPSLPFNPITLQYRDDTKGVRLKYDDDMVKYRALLRTKNMYERENSNYNPINGAPRFSFPHLHRPDLPGGYDWNKYGITGGSNASAPSTSSSSSSAAASASSSSSSSSASTYPTRSLSPALSHSASAQVFSNNRSLLTNSSSTGNLGH